jgi:ABC-type Fe3+/spermidine/putrescine transport system ATPase subunit
MAGSLRPGDPDLIQAAVKETVELAAMDVPELELKDVTKTFSDVPVVDRCNLRLTRGEVLVLLGPSGCGKSTLLNLIAGFEQPDTGTVSFRGKVVNNVPPYRRNVALVFQHYALFPHMTIAENIAYGLTARRMAKADIAERVTEMLALLKLEKLAARYPAQLSGGQRQRAAVARALAIRPDMLLLDEAFSALDRNLREDMQLELSLLLRRLNVTTVVVTHDQREAFVMADRIAVMEEGRFAQVGSPEEVYRNPTTSSVFRFLGTVNSLNAKLIENAGERRLQVAQGLAFAVPEGAKVSGDAEMVVEIRAEDIGLSESPTQVHATRPASVRLRTFLGSHERIVLDLNGEQLLVDRPAYMSSWPIEAGQQLYLDFDPRRCRLSRR